MREIVDQLFQTGYEHDLGIGWCYVLVGEEELILIDPGYGWHFRPKTEKKSMNGNVLARSESLITPALLDLLDFSASLSKPITKGILTHSHADHSTNMSLLLQKSEEINAYYETDIVDLNLIVHRNSIFKKSVWRKINVKTELVIGGHTVNILPTPGHSQGQEDLSIYLPEKKLLFCGDLCQPQGREFHICEGPSPIPFFVHGDQTKQSLEELMELDFEVLLTSHGYQYQREDGIHALQLTHSLLEKIDNLAQRLLRENPDEHLDTIALWIYDTITHQRQFDSKRAEFRKMHYDRNGVSDFQKYDKITIDYFLSKYITPSTAHLNNEY
ncbi:MBL fold metallo-hydrolase [candidate division CSSED10-310 bacterium]|uniref:MBL fold metallo-hydrolase n=1 Tax=candidate division CSSED10-310 bacterium TaxID=2855610 RepID=A0ABV6Z268_UNCC1